MPIPGEIVLVDIRVPLEPILPTRQLFVIFGDLFTERLADVLMLGQRKEWLLRTQVQRLLWGQSPVDRWRHGNRSLVNGADDTEERLVIAEILPPS